MPVGYLVSVVFTAVCTGFALVAPRRPRFLRPVAFRLGLVFAELPFLAFFLLLGATALAFAQGDVGGPGWVVVGLAVLVTAGLGELARRGLLARDAVDRALGRRPRSLPWARILFAPFAVRRRGVRRVANVSYGPAGKRNLLDVYRPSTPTGPTLVYWHGGGYFSGRKNREARALLYRLASRGWVCVSANYRLRPQATFPDHLVDAKRVIAWVREHGREYGADPARVVVAGSSAGGHLASLCALTQNDPGFQPGFEHVDTSVSAAISFYGYYGEYTVLSRARRRTTTSGPTRRRSSSRTVTGIHWCRWRRPAASPSDSVRCRPIRWSMWSCPAVIIRSTCSTRSGSPRSSTRWSFMSHRPGSRGLSI